VLKETASAGAGESKAGSKRGWIKGAEWKAQERNVTTHDWWSELNIPRGCRVASDLDTLTLRGAPLSDHQAPHSIVGLHTDLLKWFPYKMYWIKNVADNHEHPRG
jgi:hypothetical protein